MSQKIFLFGSDWFWVESVVLFPVDFCVIWVKINTTSRVLRRSLTSKALCRQLIFMGVGYVQVSHRENDTYVVRLPKRTDNPPLPVWAAQVEAATFGLLKVTSKGEQIHPYDGTGCVKSNSHYWIKCRLDDGYKEHLINFRNMRTTRRINC